MGEALSPFLVRKLNYNFESSATAVNEAIRGGEKKKGVTPFRAKDGGSNRNQALRTLLFYSSSLAVSESMTCRKFHGNTLRF
jgi:hypothetical protein